MTMNIADLIERLQELCEEEELDPTTTPIYVATQPHYPLAMTVENVSSPGMRLRIAEYHMEDDEELGGNGDPRVFIATDATPSYPNNKFNHPYAPRAAWEEAEVW